MMEKHCPLFFAMLALALIILVFQPKQKSAEPDPAIKMELERLIYKLEVREAHIADLHQSIKRLGGNQDSIAKHYEKIRPVFGGNDSALIWYFTNRYGLDNAAIQSAGKHRP
jgi:hypothetical protein